MNPRPFTWLSLSFFGYFCAYGVFVPFFPVWLKSQAYGAELIGLVVASSYFFRFAGGLLFANFVKQAHHLLSMLRVLAWASVGVMALISIVTENFWLLFAAIGLFSMINSAGIAITDTLATTWQQQVKLDYGKARLIGVWKSDRSDRQPKYCVDSDRTFISLCAGADAFAKRCACG